MKTSFNQHGDSFSVRQQPGVKHEPASEAAQPEQNEVCCFLHLGIHQQVVAMDDAFARLLDADTSLLWVKRVCECLPLCHRLWFREMTEQAQAGNCCQHEVLLQDENGCDMWMRFKFSPLYNSKRIIKGITCIGTNVNKEKMQEQKLANQKVLLREIADTYSHQLRHPLTNILAIINLMKEDDGSVSNVYFEYLEKASQQLDAVIRTVVNQTYVAA